MADFKKLVNELMNHGYSGTNAVLFIIKVSNVVKGAMSDSLDKILEDQIIEMDDISKGGEKK